LLQASVPTEAGLGASSKSVPPTHEELARAFPQLEILELIGQGGMGFVFKARQPRIDRLVALKILPRALAADPAFAERFTREGRVLAKLGHPNIVTLHDFGQANGFFYLLMEFVDGVNLRQAMKAGRFTPAQALAIVPKICEALHVAHVEGILHRDIKPENILLDSRGRVKIADFGIAKLIGEPPADALQTGPGATLGTPHYMAPEQLEKPAEVDHRADIYSLGVVFYEMLTGELPLGKFQPPSQKVEVDVRLDEIVLHALEKEPARRYQQVSQVKTAVDTLAGNVAPPTAGANSPVLTVAAAAAGRPDHFWRWFAMAALALVALIVILAPVAYWYSGSTREQSPDRPEANGARPTQAPPLIIDTAKWEPINPEPGELRWGFKAFVPPDHLASLVFVCWTNGVPTINQGFSTYFKVGKAGGIDIEFCSISCHRISDSPRFLELTDAARQQTLASWHFPESAGVTNAVRWDVNLGAGYTVSSWIAMPLCRRREVELPRNVQSGHQRALHLADFVGPNGDEQTGQSGVEVRILLEPRRLPPVRTRPNETDRTTYIAGRGLAGTLEETLQAMRQLPMDR
jgi:serine/threonine protein kinase